MKTFRNRLLVASAPLAIAIGVASCDSRSILDPTPKAGLTVNTADFRADADFVESDRYTIAGTKVEDGACKFVGRFNEGARIILKDEANCQFLVSEGVWKHKPHGAGKAATDSVAQGLSKTGRPVGRPFQLAGVPIGKHAQAYFEVKINGDEQLLDETRIHLYGPLPMCMDEIYGVHTAWIGGADFSVDYDGVDDESLYCEDDATGGWVTGVARYLAGPPTCAPDSFLRVYYNTIDVWYAEGWYKQASVSYTQSGCPTLETHSTAEWM